jgi:hypothetical protein
MTPGLETEVMQNLRSPKALGLTALGVLLIAIGVAGLLARPFAGSAFASPLTGGAQPWQWMAGPHESTWQGKSLPPQLSGLMDVPAGERFQHFRGVQVQLTDKDNQPVTVVVTPGTVTAVSATSLTINGNDGAAHTYALDDKTMEPGQAAKQNDQVVVAAIGGSSTATAVVRVDPNGSFAGPHGPWGR